MTDVFGVEQEQGQGNLVQNGQLLRSRQLVWELGLQVTVGTELHYEEEGGGTLAVTLGADDIGMLAVNHMSQLLHYLGFDLFPAVRCVFHHLH